MNKRVWLIAALLLTKTVSFAQQPVQQIMLDPAAGMGSKVSRYFDQVD